MIIDIETTGLQICRSKIVMIGIQTVINGVIEPDTYTDIMIQTPYDPEVWGCAYAHHDNTPQLLEKLAQYDLCNEATFRAIDENNGSIYGCPVIPQDIQEMRELNEKLLFRTAVDATGITPARTVAEGVPRLGALELLFDLVRQAQLEGVPIIGHNIVNFDLPFIACELEEVLGVTNDELELDDNLILDTGMVVKGGQLNLRPYPDESNYRFCKRVSALRRRVKWSLDRFCVPTFSLDTQYGIDPSMQHKSAGYDCWVTGCLINEFAKHT